MPQFELVNFAPQFVWLVIAFSVLYFGIVRPTLPKLGRAIDAREQQVQGDIDTAARAKAEADDMAAAYDASIARAQDDARVRVESARGRATAALEAKLADSNADLAAKAADADAALSAARAHAMTAIESVSADAASDIVEKLTGSRPPPQAAEAAIRSALA